MIRALACSLLLLAASALRMSVRMSSGPALDSSLMLSELFSSPTARYNGALISPTVKVVEVPPKPADYQYGAVSGDSTPVLIFASFLVVALAAAVPAFLSVGESAKKQQAGFEKTNKVGFNEFAVKSRTAAKAPAVTVVGAKKAAAPVAAKKPAAAPAPAKKGAVAPAAAPKPSFSNPFAPKPKAVPAPAPVAPPAKKGPFDFFGKK